MTPINNHGLTIQIPKTPDNPTKPVPPNAPPRKKPEKKENESTIKPAIAKKLTYFRPGPL